MFNFSFPLFRSNSYQGRSLLGGKTSGAFFLIFGLVFMVIGGFIFLDNQRTKDWPVVTGTVQDVESYIDYDNDGGSQTKYRYSIMYIVNGERHATSQTSSGRVTNGTTKQVAYNPDSPQDSRVRSSGDWLLWVLFIAMGGLFAVIGAITLFKSLGSRASVAEPLVTPPVQQPLQPQQPQIQQPSGAPTMPNVPSAPNDGVNNSGSQPPTS